ncbi:MAG: LysM peptidoglycan-binding domain-containing protein, partial [Alistipes sp.]|nr:LysM peptidoglycan-binding domain-containing protein [Alistipes sp.]
DRISIGQKIRVKGVATTESDTQPIATETASYNDEVWHTVIDGDLVGRIAAQYGTTTRRIKELNPELNPDKISIGQRIRVK